MAPTAALRHEHDHAAALDDADKLVLTMLRFIGARCRAMARTDLFKACAMLSDDRSRAVEAVCTALLRSFSGTGDMPRLRLYEVTSTEVSFDERWLLAALSAARRGDTDSLTFLLARRVPAHARRQIGFLVAALIDAMDRKAQAA